VLKNVADAVDASGHSHLHEAGHPPSLQQSAAWQDLAQAHSTMCLGADGYTHNQSCYKSGVWASQKIHRSLLQKEVEHLQTEIEQVSDSKDDGMRMLLKRQQRRMEKYNARYQILLQEHTTTKILLEKAVESSSYDPARAYYDYSTQNGSKHQIDTAAGQRQAKLLVRSAHCAVDDASRKHQKSWDGIQYVCYNLIFYHGLFEKYLGHDIVHRKSPHLARFPL